MSYSYFCVDFTSGSGKCLFGNGSSFKKGATPDGLVFDTKRERVVGIIFGGRFYDKSDENYLENYKLITSNTNFINTCKEWKNDYKILLPVGYEKGEDYWEQDSRYSRISKELSDWVSGNINDRRFISLDENVVGRTTTKIWTLTDAGMVEFSSIVKRNSKPWEFIDGFSLFDERPIEVGQVRPVFDKKKYYDRDEFYMHGTMYRIIELPKRPYPYSHCKCVYIDENGGYQERMVLDTDFVSTKIIRTESFTYEPDGDWSSGSDASYWGH